MGEGLARIARAQVMHKRLSPKKNSFCYHVNYLILPLLLLEQEKSSLAFKVNQWGMLSFHEKDHGYRDGSALRNWARDVFIAHGLTAPEDIVLICMPRLLGYVFNPVSFWVCRNSQAELVGVIAEVNNTFGETYTYLCCHGDLSAIQKNEWLETKKEFHVSPFFQREGFYRFRFQFDQDKICIDLIYYDQDKQPLLKTRLKGSCLSLKQHSINYLFLKSPLMTLKVIGLIHLQALKLVFKGIKYMTKPKSITQKFK